MRDEMKRFLQEEIEKEANKVMNEVEQDASVADVKAPSEMRAKLFEQIRQSEREETYENLPEEYRELIDLGRVYQKKKKRKKYYVLAAALVAALAIGVTSIGGPERLFREIQWTIGGREQVNVDSESDRVEPADAVKEEEAYQEVKEEFGIEPVRMYYLPEQTEFLEAVLDEETKMVQFSYYVNDKKCILYRINTNYNEGSMGFDTEDRLMEEKLIYQGEIPIEMKRYRVEETEESKWIVKFEYQKIHYSIVIRDIEKDEIEKIVKNLKFY